MVAHRLHCCHPLNILKSPRIRFNIKLHRYFFFSLTAIATSSTTTPTILLIVGHLHVNRVYVVSVLALRRLF